MSTLGDLMGMFNTRLSPQDEARFERAYPNPNDSYDYDMRGAFKSGAKQAANGHLPDTYKKPNHPTFSRESIYSTPDNPGGTWVPVPGTNEKRWVFYATPANARYRTLGDLADYFTQNEPDSTVLLPLNYDLGHR